jgi:hypothetical protein
MAGNHLLPATPAISNPDHYDLPVNASRHPIMLGGRKVRKHIFCDAI